MNTEEDEFRRIEAEAKRRAARLKEIMYWVTMDDDDDTQVYTSDVALAEAYRCGFEAGAVAEREACAGLAERRFLIDKSSAKRTGHHYACKSILADIRARGTT